MKGSHLTVAQEESQHVSRILEGSSGPCVSPSSGLLPDSLCKKEGDVFVLVKLHDALYPMEPERHLQSCSVARPESRESRESRDSAQGQRSRSSCRLCC